MLILKNSADSWPSGDFRTTLKTELESLPTGRLPLQRCLTIGSHVLDAKPDIIILGIDDDGGIIRVRIGVFFNSIIAGCSCADDPTPIDPVNEYAELSVILNKQTGSATLSPIT